jgi:hypothetical protein
LKKKIIIGIVAVFVLMVVIAAVSGGSNQPQKIGESQNMKATETPTNHEYKVGDQIKLGEVILTINKVETSEGSQYTKPQEGNQWVNLNMTIENTGNNQKYITTMGQMFVLDDGKNQYQVAVTDKRLANPGSLGLDGAIVAGAKKTDWVGFEVPKTAKSIKFQYNASMFNTGNVLVNLGM